MTAAKVLTPAALARILRKLPEKKLRIIDLAPELLTPDGKVDIEKCMERHGEVLPAIEEVKNYVADCKAARYRLDDIKGKSFDDDDDDDGIAAPDDDEPDDMEDGV